MSLELVPIKRVTLALSPSDFGQHNSHPQEGRGTESEQKTDIVANNFPASESRTGIAGTAFQEPKSEYLSVRIFTEM